MAFDTFSDTLTALFELLSSKHRVKARSTYSRLPTDASETGIPLQILDTGFGSAEVQHSKMTEKRAESGTSRFMRKIVRLNV